MNALIIHSRCNATLPARTWTKPLRRAARNRLPKIPMITLPAREGDHQAHEQGRRAHHQADGDEDPPGRAVVGEVPRPDAPDELEGASVR